MPSQRKPDDARAHGSPLRGLLLALLACVWTPGCGEGTDPGPVEQTVEQQLLRLATAEGEDVGGIVAILSDLGRRKPQVVVPRLVRALSEEREDAFRDRILVHFDLGDLPAAQHSDVLAGLSNVLAARLSANGYFGASLQVDGRNSAILVSLGRPRDEQGRPLDAKATAAVLERAAWRISQPGTIDLQLHVPPPQAGQAMAPLGPPDEAAFGELLTREHELLARAEREGRTYVPGQPPFRAALLRPAQPGQAPQPILLRESEAPNLRFGRDAFEVQLGVDPDSGDQFLSLQLRADRQEDFESFTRAHVGRGLALVVNGRVELIVRLGAPVREEMRFPLGNARNPADAAWAEGILRLTAGGAYPHRARPEVLSAAPKDLSTPIARALIEIGAPVLPALQPLSEEAGPLGERAAWIAAEIHKQAGGTRGRPRAP